MPDLTPGYTVRDLAARYRVGEDKVRTWIKSGELAAINTAAVACAKPRYVVTADAIHDFERRRNAATPAPTKKARRKITDLIDYYP